MKKPDFTLILLLLPLALVTALVLAACGAVLLQSLGHVPAFGLAGLTLGYYRDVDRKSVV